jgi:hypothetical protein
MYNNLKILIKFVNPGRSVPVQSGQGLSGSVGSVGAVASTGSPPVPTGVGAADRPQETLYVKNRVSVQKN